MEKEEHTFKAAQVQAIVKLLGDYNLTNTQAAAISNLNRLAFSRALSAKYRTVLGNSIVEALCASQSVEPERVVELLRLTEEALGHKDAEGLPRLAASHNAKIYLRCQACGSEQAFRPGTLPRFCVVPSCDFIKQYPSHVRGSLVTHVPEWREEVDPSRLPSLCQCNDLLPQVVPYDVEIELHPISVSESEAVSYLEGLLPYETDWMRKKGFSCGSPILFRSNRVKNWVLDKPQAVDVLDFAGYSWTRTLKDPRSWAIVNAAIESRKKHLSLWTAGNAGLSLAMMAASANKFLPPDKRLSVYGFHSAIDPSVVEPMTQWGARTTEIRTSAGYEALNPASIMSQVKSFAGGPWNDDDCWNVTDAWESVGMLMYRLIFCQVIWQLRPSHIIAPLGSGNLLMGILKAVKDCHPIPVKVVAAVAHGEHALVDRHVVRPPAKGPSHEALVLTKIAGTYSALLPCLKFFQTGRGEVPMSIKEVDLRDLRYATEMLARNSRDLGIVAEPSSISAFAALPKLCEEEDGADLRPLVVNTGFGTLSLQEQLFLKDPDCYLRWPNHH